MEYTEVKMEDIKKLAEVGHTPAFIRRFMDISDSDWTSWMNRHPEFSENLNAWSSGVSDRIRAVVAKKALGYKYEVKRFLPNSKTGHVKTYIETITVAPDLNAARFWLTCREPGEWVERSQSDVNVNTKPGVSKEDLASRVFKVKDKKEKGEDATADRALNVALG